MKKKTYLDYSENIKKPIKEIPVNEIKNLNDTQLANYHSKLHNYWQIIIDGITIIGWNKNKIIRAHKYVVMEYPKRKMKHYWVNDLDKTIPENKTIKDKKKRINNLTKKINNIINNL